MTTPSTQSKTSRALRFGLFLAMAFASACASEASPKNNTRAVASTPAPSADETLLYEGEPSPYLRVDLRQSPQGISLLGSATVMRARPVPSHGGDAMVVAVSGDEIVGASFVSFPKQIWLEGRLEGRIVSRSSVALNAGSDASVFLPSHPEITAIRVIDPSGNVLDEIPFEPKGDIAGQSQALTGSEFARKYPHIRVVDPSSDYAFPPDLTDQGAELSEATPALLAAVAAGLDAAAPAARASVADVVPVRLRDRGVITCGTSSNIVVALGGGSAIFVNVDYAHPDLLASGLASSPAQMVKALVHETVHNFHFLIDGAATSAYPIDAWPSEARELASEAIAQHHLSNGLTNYWATIQESAANFNLGGRYHGTPGCIPDVPEHLAEGFATEYGATNLNEDVAEVAAQVQAHADDPSLICAFFAQQGGTLTQESALLYTKAVFLRHLGLVTETSLQRCLAGLRVTNKGPGIHLQAATGQLPLVEDVRAGELVEAGRRSLIIQASGGGYRGMLRLLDPYAQPLGVHRLSFIHTGNTLTANNGFLAAHDDRHRARGSAAGLVFVTEASDEKIEGVILFLSMHNALNIVTDLFWMAPFSASW